MRRRSGPKALDAKLAALTPDVHDCYEHVIHRTIPRLVEITFADTTHVEPDDAPFALVQCIVDALRGVHDATVVVLAE